LLNKYFEYLNFYLSKIFKFLNYFWYILLCFNLFSNLLLVSLIYGFFFNVLMSDSVILKESTLFYIAEFENNLSNLIIFIFIEFFYICYLKYIKTQYPIVTRYFRFLMFIFFLLEIFNLFHLIRFFYHMFIFSFRLFFFL
jgi:hypothetical protein